jgi:hypothetical protein
MAIKYINNYQSKVVQNLPQLGFLFENKPSGNPGELMQSCSLTAAKFV